MVFFLPVTSSLAGKRLIPSELASELGERYGLHVPPLVIESLAERMANSGLLKKIAEMATGATYAYAT